MRTITLRTNVIVILALAAISLVDCLVSQAGNGRNFTYLALGDSLTAGVIQGERAEMRVYVNAHVSVDGAANGPLHVRVVGGDSFLYRAVQGEVTIDQGTIVEMMLVLEGVVVWWT